MKQLIPFLLLFTLWVGCKKDVGKPKEILLSEVSTDGVVNSRIQYTADNKLTRFENYSGNALSSYFTVDYDAAGHIAKRTSFKAPGDIPLSRVLVECDGEGKIIKAANYDLQGNTPNTPVDVSTYTYNAQQLLSKLVRKDKNDQLLASINLFYFPDGNLKEAQVFKEANNLLWLSQKVAFSVPNGFYPKGVEQLKQLLGPDFTATLFSEGIQSYSYDQNGGIMTHGSWIMSGREFNTDGSLKRQAQTYTSIKPVQVPTVVNKAYGYILQ